MERSPVSDYRAPEPTAIMGHMKAPAAGIAMIGREADLQVLRDALVDANDGVTRCVAIGGEAGMGKTRLLTEFRSTIDPDAIVLTADCIDLGSMGVPFGPVRSIMRQLVAAVGAGAVLDAAGPGRPGVVALLPELADGSESGSEPLHETLTALLGKFALNRPIVVIIDDAQWADAATVSLLRFVLRTLSEVSFLAVIAYRSEDAGRDHLLRQLLAELDQARAVTRRELRGLDDAEIVALVTQVNGSIPDRESLDRIIRRSQGVPFFVEELVALGSARIPDTLRDVLLTRYERLDPAAQSFLRALAVGGMRVDHDVLSRVLDEKDFDPFARAATEEAMLVTSDEGYAFRHALVREAVENELLPGERRNLHQRYAEALAEFGGPASEMSYHWYAAHDLPRALSASVAAYDDALAGHAFASALQLGERALELWDQVPDASEVAGRPRPVLLADLTATALNSGDRKRGIALADEALAAADPEDRLGRIELLRLKAQMWAEEALPGAEELYLEALAVLGESDDEPVLRARLLMHLSTRYELTGRIDAARTLTEEALQIARRSASDEMVSRALLNLSYLEILDGEIDRGHALIDEALRYAGDGEELLRYGNNASDSHVLLGEYRAALEVAERPIRRARELGLERSWGGILSNTVDALIGLGRWDEAVEQGQRVLAIQPSGCSISTQHRRSIMLANWQDDTPRAAAIARAEGPLIRAFAAHGDLQDTLPTAITLGELALFQGDLDEAWRQVSILWDPPHEGAAGYDLPLLGLASRIIAERRRIGAPVPDDAVEVLDAVFDRMPSWPTVPRWRALVAAELSGPDGTGTDVEAWRVAVAEASDESMAAHIRAYTWWRLGGVELGAGDRTVAAASLRTAADQADRIGATWISNRARELLQTAGLGDRPKSGSELLTARERQVLELIAEGLSNREISQRLFISTKTTSVHVSSILRKLGASSRTQAAMMAERVPTGDGS